MRTFVWLLVALTVGFSGCMSESKFSDTDSANQRSTETTGGKSAASESNSEKLTLEPYDPPRLEELDKNADWTDGGEMLDGMELLRARQAGERPPLSFAEALKLRNDDPAVNERIRASMGRLPASESDVDWDDTFNRHMLIDVKSTNPILASTVQEQDLLSYTGLELFGFDWNMKPFVDKSVVKSWQTSKDHMLDKIVLRDDLTWSDGRPVTAHDVVFTFKTIMDPEVPTITQRTDTSRLRWIEAYDDHTLVYFHKQPLATNLTVMNFPIIPKHVYESEVAKDKTLKTSEAFQRLEKKPVVGGAYEIVKNERSAEILLKRRESWYMHNGKQVREKPYFDQVRFRIKPDPNTALLDLKSGDLDELEISAEQWLSQTGDDEFYRHNIKATAVEWTYFYFGWNNHSPYFQDRRVRQAMSYAFDHREMLDSLFHGLYQPANGLFHPDSWLAPKKPTPVYEQDLDKAEALLDEAGWSDHDGDGIRDKETDGRLTPFEFTIIVRQDPARIRCCELLKSSLDKIGVICNITSLEGTTLQQRMDQRDFVAAFAGWGTGSDPDTSSNIWTTEAIKSGRNYLNYSNKEVDRLYEQARVEFDREKRGEIYGRIHTLIYDDQPCTFLYYQNAFYGFNRRLRGYNFSPRGPYSFSPGIFSIWAER
jgi:peptide/nickel transport system substrate-binding protein